MELPAVFRLPPPREAIPEEVFGPSVASHRTAKRLAGGLGAASLLLLVTSALGWTSEIAGILFCPVLCAAVFVGLLALYYRASLARVRQIAREGVLVEAMVEGVVRDSAGRPRLELVASSAPHPLRARFPTSGAGDLAKTPPGTTLSLLQVPTDGKLFALWVPGHGLVPYPR